MTMARSQVVEEGVVGVYHATSRCVRRAFLCGEDAYTGKNYEHRRQWIQDRLELLSGCYCVDVFSYSVMSSHWHVVLRTRPDLADELSAEEVARRWVRIYPRKHNGGPAAQELAVETRLKEIIANPQRVETLRLRLGSLSQFMKAMNEQIARRSNREDGVTGHFWESRFKCQALLDEAAILTCMAYVDLNPVRAKMAEGLEDSLFTSAYDRIKAREARQKQEVLASMGDALHPVHVDKLAGELRPELDTWLFSLSGDEVPVSGLTEAAYLELLDATGRCIRSGKRGVIDPSVMPILESLDINVEKWAEGVARYGSRVYRVVGHIEAICSAAGRSTVKFFKGRELCRELYAAPSAVSG